MADFKSIKPVDIHALQGKPYVPQTPMSQSPTSKVNITARPVDIKRQNPNELKAALKTLYQIIQEFPKQTLITNFNDLEINMGEKTVNAQTLINDAIRSNDLGEIRNVSSILHALGKNSKILTRDGGVHSLAKYIIKAREKDGNAKTEKIVVNMSDIQGKELQSANASVQPQNTTQVAQTAPTAPVIVHFEIGDEIHTFSFLLSKIKDGQGEPFMA